MLEAQKREYFKTLLSIPRITSELESIVRVNMTPWLAGMVAVYEHQQAIMDSGVMGRPVGIKGLNVGVQKGDD